MTKQDLAETIAKKLELSKAKAEEFINMMIDEITMGLRKGDEIVLAGLGKFLVVKKKERQARNPKTGEMVTVPAKKAPKFRPGKQLKDAVK